ncbi:beta-aspartyl-peptidase [Parabacteroides sp. PF5-6]|uniref:beta-aspartyl-peptidase n=1 Tax=Parabacteroides sp. PF5-6 TaxID=1742403 RepID=UPI002404BF5A|nr:beta-aspartyl-peptidase [Parabacteroides sp. PF5-6]MDF9831395.1 beta-aspartyl-dipeptidase (metallo-type) [Parabacteroides sp. PF5-6]
MKFKVIKNANLYSPEKKGVNDLLIVGDKIALVDKKISLSGVEVELFDAEGKVVTPGFIDQHVHITGAGGQVGYASLVPEVQLSDLIAHGTTTVVGLLGTDGFVKELSSLYAKAKALDAEGLSAYMLTGYYGLPEKTMLNSVAEDLIFIDKVIGCKVAMSDDRSSFPTEMEILRLINQVRLGGFTSGKVGVLHIHLGNLPEGISILLDIAKRYPSLISYLSPTHLIRTEALFNQAISFAKMGGMVDFSTGGTKFDAPHRCVVKALEAGVPLDRITFSSDGRGGVRKFNPATGEDTYTPAPLDLNLKEMGLLVKECGLSLEQALQLITTNPASNMHLPAKGRIEKGYDADLCLLDEQLRLTDVFAKGEQMMRDGKIIKKGRYEV